MHRLWYKEKRERTRDIQSESSGKSSGMPTPSFATLATGYATVCLFVCFFVCFNHTEFTLSYDSPAYPPSGWPARWGRSPSPHSYYLYPLPLPTLPSLRRPFERDPYCSQLSVKYFYAPFTEVAAEGQLPASPAVIAHTAAVPTLLSPESGSIRPPGVKLRILLLYQPFCGPLRCTLILYYPFYHTLFPKARPAHGLSFSAALHSFLITLPSGVSMMGASYNSFNFVPSGAFASHAANRGCPACRSTSSGGSPDSRISRPRRVIARAPRVDLACRLRRSWRPSCQDGISRGEITVYGRGCPRCSTTAQKTQKRLLGIWIGHLRLIERNE